MKKKVLDFYKSIQPHAYHIEDAAMDNHIRGGKDLEMFIRSAKMLAREGVLTSSRPDVYQYEEQQYEEYEGKNQAKSDTGSGYFTCGSWECCFLQGFGRCER